MTKGSERIARQNRAVDIARAPRRLVAPGSDYRQVEEPNARLTWCSADGSENNRWSSARP